MYYTVYEITNKINGKTYIGCHKTKDLEDGYMGSGKHLIYSQNKYGIENFDKKILHTYDNAEEMFNKEAELVTELFIKDTSNYNLKVGGFGGFGYINSNPEKFLTEKRLKALEGNEAAVKAIAKLYENSESFREKVVVHMSSMHKKLKEMYPEGTWKGKKHSEETKKKIGRASAKHQSGKGNSQYGKMWIYNKKLKQSKRIDKNDTIPDGWFKGRKINFQD